MRSKWYKLMGGEQKKRLWVLKTTSQNSTGPKPKYVGKIVAALWERELTMGSVFMLLRDRPLAESPVVAMKGLITLMKVGVRAFCSCCVCVSKAVVCARWGE